MYLHTLLALFTSFVDMWCSFCNSTSNERNPNSFHCEFEEASLMQKEQKSDKMAVVGKKRLETTDDSTIDDDEEERSLSGYFFHWH